MKYSQAPLCYLGQKRNLLRYTQEVLNEMQGDGVINQETLFIDVFGGSGLLAHNIKQWFPKNRVIWNDYDNYQERLEHLQETEILRKQIKEIIDKEPLKHDNKLPTEIKEKILECIKAFENDGYIDYTTISAYVLFAGTYAKDFKELEKYGFYNRISATTLNAIGYLDGVIRVQQDFKELLDTYRDLKNKLLILDPPYIQTISGHYRDCFRIGKFFELIQRVQKPYIFYGSDKSDVIECFEYFKTYHKELENYSINQGALLNGIDYILYPKGRSLFS